jgi:psp operon transcriptional activator
VRIIGATNEDLPAMVERGSFRADLLDRLAFDVITLPPLRERRDDIMPMAEYFAVKMCGELGLELFSGFSPKAREQLLDYSWPGNVRELKNVIERAVYALANKDEPIGSINFDPFHSPWRPQSLTGESNPADPVRLPTSPYDFKELLQQQEIELLQSALKQCRYNQKKTAEFLGMSYHQLRGYLRKYELTEGENSADG